MFKGGAGEIIVRNAERTTRGAAAYVYILIHTNLSSLCARVVETQKNLILIKFINYFIFNLNIN